MLIETQDNKLIIKFAYSPRIVEAVKKIPGRLFESKYKRWTVPADHVEMAVQILQPLGFTYGPDIKKLLDGAAEARAKLELIKVSPGLYEGSLPLFNFQKTGAMWLREAPSALLGDVPGLGKTIQTIAALEGIKNILVLCPASLKYGWQEEIVKWTPPVGPGAVNAVVVDGTKEERAVAWKMPQTNVSPTYIIANYELLLHDYDEIPKNWDAIVCDEASRIANPNAKSVQALKTLRAPKKIALSGTPVSNSPLDIFGIVDWLRPGYLGNIYQFQKNYTVEVDMGSFKKIVGYKNLDDLAAKIAPLMLRRTKDEVLTDFPPKVIKDIIFDLSEGERKIYEGVRTLILNELGASIDKIDSRSLNILPVKMLRLKQVTGHPNLIGQYAQVSSKLELLNELVAENIQNGEKTIVFTQFAQMAKLIEGYFEMQGGINPLLIYGEKSSALRAEAVQEFSKGDFHKVMIMTEAGAYGLNLQAASYVIHYDMPWSIAKLMQREDRAHRIGQTKPVTVYNLIARDTIDEYVAKVLFRKQKISVDILQDDDRLEAAGLSETDIKAILRI